MKLLFLSTKVTIAPLAVLSHDRVHLPVTHSLSVGMCGPVVNGNTVVDWCPCARGGTSRLSPSVPEMPADVVLVVWGDGSYPVVDGGLGYRKTLLLHEPALNLFG